jgi:hypothetical protein
MIGSLLWLIRDAACQAILDGTEKITRQSPGQIAIDMTAQAPPPRTCGRLPCSPSFPAWASATPGQRSTTRWSATASRRTRVPTATRRA